MMSPFQRVEGYTDRINIEKQNTFSLNTDKFKYRFTISVAAPSYNKRSQQFMYRYIKAGCFAEEKSA